MDPQALIQAYLDDELTDAQFAELSAWLSTSESNREVFVQAVTLDTNIHHHLAQSDLHAFLEEVDVHALQDALEQSKQASTTAMLAITSAEIKANDDVTLGRAVSVLTHAGLNFAGRSLRKHAAQLALAAIVLLGVILAIVLLTGPDKGAPIANAPINQDKPAAPAQPTTRGSDTQQHPIVATLTATHNATWSPNSAEGASAPGSPLHPGDRLTLTHGFAQITTHRGAVAILEAPCTVEFSDSLNALRLTNGKLVASCLTPESKGFAVQAGETRIVDIGTEFGVSVDETDGVDVQVFTGLVVADVISEDGQINRQPLVEGESARIASGQFEKRVSDDTLAFKRTLPYEATAPQLTGNIRWMDAPHTNLRETGFSDANQAYVLQERVNATVSADLAVSHPAASAPINPYMVNRIGVPARADVYLLRFYPGNQSGSVTGTITFDRPILGVIAGHVQLRGSDATLGLPGDVQYTSHPSRGMENGKASFGDDGKTLKIHIDKSKGQFDEMRILVAPAENPAGETGADLETSGGDSPVVVPTEEGGVQQP